MSVTSGLGRRKVLRGMLGGAAVTVALPFLDCLLDANGTALADGTELPVIFANWFFGCGFNPGRWEPKSPGKLTDVGPELDPIRPYLSKVNVFSGFQVSLDGKPSLPHVTGRIAVQTGTVAGAGQRTTLPSVDTIVADIIGTRTRFRSLEVSCIGSENSVSVRAGNIMNPSEVSPAALYARIFGPDFRDPNAADFTPDPRVMARQSVLSGVKNQLADIQGTIGAADKIRLDEYLTSLRQLEQQLALELQKPEALKACSVPRKPAGELPPSAEVAAMQTNHRLFVQLIAYALACGQTRVANIAATEGLSTLHRAGDGVIHHTYTHEEQVDPQLGYQPRATAFIGDIVTAMADMIATFDGFREGDRTLLDRMLVWVSTETGYAKVHALDNIPALTIGGANGRIRTGQHVRTAGDPITRIGLTVQQAMGVPVGSWGTDSLQTSRSIAEILV
jgi:hypothetical protein